uniref:Uncharacterized protein n=1 Tax=Anguilla anguilla TaxID=7936 RepID=A0A0E9TNB4_ANGAN
MKRDEMVRSVG